MSVSRSKPWDGQLLIVTTILVVLGIILVFDSSFPRAADHKAGDLGQYVKMQIAYALAGALALYAASRCHPETFRKVSKAALYVSIVLLGLVMVPGIGKSIAGSARWIPIGPFHLQPSEIAKLGLVMYLADELAEKGFAIRRVPWLLMILFPVAVAIGLIVLEDMGTASVAVFTTAIILFVAGIKKRHLLTLGAIGAGMGTLMILVEDYRRARMLSFIDPLSSYDGGGYQISHSLFALATGGLRGAGWFEGVEKYYIPAPQTDMICATLGEEAGWIGMAVMLGLFIWLTARGLSIAHKSKSPYMSLLALGITSVIAVQALMNIAVLTSSMPATGVPMPFMSYGGSHLIMSLFAIGMMLSISRHSDEKMEEPEQGEHEDSRNGRGNGRTYISCAQRRPAAKKPGRRTPVRR